jgi:LacI family transcriptional regulator
MRRSTINDVARHAGVSKSTVSHVINNTRFVEDETRQRVLQAIQEIGYRPSNVARSLTTQRTGTVGAIISDASNQFFGDVLRGAEDVLRPLGYGLVVCNTDEILEREAEYIDYLLRQRVDGIIAAATSQRWDVLSIADMMHTPVVYLDRAFEGLDGPYVGVDNRSGAYQGTRHLIEAGCGEIGILAGFQRLSTMRERLDGFLQAVLEAHLPLVEEWVVESPLSMEAGRQAAYKILSLPQRPRALFISNNFLSLGALLAIKELGLLCPEDIALVGFDDHPWTAVSRPPLTVVRQPARELGQQAARVLSTLIEEKPLSESRIVFPCELILRESCCITPHVENGAVPFNDS